MLVDSQTKIVEALLEIRKEQKEDGLKQEIVQRTGLKPVVVHQGLKRLIELGIIESRQRAFLRVFKVNQGKYAKELLTPKRAWKSDKITKGDIAKKMGISRQWKWELDRRKNPTQ